MKRYAFSLFLVALILGLYLCLSTDLALSIPAPQKDCDINSVSTNSSLYAIVPNMNVTVDNGDVSRSCIITFSTEVKTSLGDVTRLSYTIDSANPVNCQSQIIGPGLFHSGATNESETVTQMGVKDIGSGTHTIRPCFSALDRDGNGARTDFHVRCLTVECRTQ